MRNLRPKDVQIICQSRQEVGVEGDPRRGIWHAIACLSTKRHSEGRHLAACQSACWYLYTHTHTLTHVLSVCVCVCVGTLLYFDIDMAVARTTLRSTHSPKSLHCIIPTVPHLAPLTNTSFLSPPSLSYSLVFYHRLLLLFTCSVRESLSGLLLVTRYSSQWASFSLKF